MANTIKIDILADVKDINKGIKDVNGKLGGFQATLGKVGSAVKTAFVAGAAAIAGGAIAGGIKDSINAASDLNETISKTQSVFGSASKDIEAFASNASRSLGLSKSEALAGAAQFGNLFDQLKIGKKASADMSKQFLSMSSDLASFNNADPSQVMDAFISATRGEFDALQTFIPTINAASVETEALALSHKKSASALTEADKVMALNSLSLKGMGKAQGDFAKTSGGLANQQRILSAKFKDAQAELGQKLLPIALKAVTFFNTGFGPATAKVGDAFKKLGGFIKSDVIPPIQSVTGFVKDNATAFLAGAAAITAVATAIGIYKAVMTTVSAVTKAYTAVQAALNVVMSLNPIGLVVLALIALAAIFVVVWKRSDQFRAVVTGAFNAVKTGITTAVGAVIGFVKKNWPLLLGIITGPIGAAVILIVKNWSRIKSAFSTGVSAVVGFFKRMPGQILSAIGGLASLLVRKGAELIGGFIKGYVGAYVAVGKFFAGVAGKILSAIGSLAKTLYSHGSDLIQGLINGIGAKAGALLQKARDLAGEVKKAIGEALKIGSPSKVMIQYGKWVSEGLAIGMKNVSGVKTAASGLAGAVADGFTAPELSLSASGAGVSGGGTITIDARGAMFLGNEREIAKKLEELLNKGSKFNRSTVVLKK